MKKSFAVIFSLIFILSFNFSSKACSPIVVPNLLSQSISGGNLLLDWQSQTGYTCTYSVQVEITCNNGTFTGNGPFFLTVLLAKTTTLQAYPQQTVDLTPFCPGVVYQFRAREVYVTGNTISSIGPWTSTFTFTVPGTFVPPTINANASNNIICPPQTSQLNVVVNSTCGGPYTYAWTPSAGLSATNIANPIASPAVSTNYIVSVDGGPFGCWTATANINISTGTAPPAVGTGSAVPAVVCVGKPTKLVLSSFTGNIQWQSGPSSGGPWTNISGALTNSFAIVPVAGNLCFQAIVSSCTGTIISNSFCVQVDPIPILAPSVVQISCTNTIATANIGNPGSSGSPTNVIWSPLPLSYASQSTIATYLNAGVVTVTASFGDGCVSIGSLTVNPPPPLPTFTIVNPSGSASITCTYPTIDLIAANNYTYGNVSYFWSSASFTAATQSVTIVNPGSYSVIVTDPVTNCSVTHSILISLNNTPPISSVSPINQSITCGPGVVATATGVAISPTVNVTHSWYAPGLSIPYNSGGQTSIYFPIPGCSTFVLTNNINGCSTTKTIQVISIGGNYPTFSLTSLQSLNQFTVGCGTRSVTDVNIVGAQTNPPGGSLSYTILAPAFTGTNYLTNTTTAYTVTAPGSYTVIVKDNVNQCETRLPLSVVQNTNGPDIIINASTRILSCDIPTVSLEGSSNTPNVTYTWKGNGNPPSFPNGTITINTTTAGASVPSGTVIDNYTLTVIDNSAWGNHCPSSTVVTMYQNTRPPKPNIALSNPALTCIVYSVNLSNNSSTGILPNTFFATQPVVAILWEGPTPQEPLPNSSTYLGYTAGVYTMTVKDLNNGCTSQTTTNVGDNRIYPIITVPKTYSLDCGSASLTITATFLPTSGLTYQWNVPAGVTVGTQTAAVLLTNSPGEYQIVASSPTNGCTSYSLVEVVSGKLFGDVEANVTNGFAPLTVNFVNNSASSLNSSSITSVWSFGNGVTKTTTTNIPTSVTYQQPGTYTMTMFAAKGACVDTVVKIIKVDIPSKLEVPNVFTPNGDNSNDLFFVKAANLLSISAVIFDRWGNKIYELTSETGNIAWDGKNQAGKEVPDGTYFYSIKATGRDGQNYDTKGTVSLYR